MTAAPLRITQVVTTDVFAGTERYVSEVAKELQVRGHDVVVIGGEPEPMGRALGTAVAWRPGASTRAAMKALARGGRRDIVHSHMTKADFVSAMTGPLVGGARVSTRHITVPRGFTPLARRIAPVVRSRLSAEIAVSTWTSQQLESPADVVLLNGVAPVPDVVGPRSNVVLVAQRLVAEKDTSTAIHAFARSGIARDGWRLVIAGAGDERDALEHLVDSLDVRDGVAFLGWVDGTGDLYRSSSILLATAPTEPCGLTVIEAMAHGLPVVAAGAGGHLETVGRHPGAALFEPGDVDAAAAQLVRLAADPAARLRYGEELVALQRGSLTLAGHVDALEGVYRDVARQPGRR